MDLLPHSGSFEPEFFQLPLKTLTSCTVNAQAPPTTLFMSPMTSVDLFADLIKMNGQVSALISAVDRFSGTERPSLS